MQTRSLLSGVAIGLFGALTAILPRSLRSSGSTTAHGSRARSTAAPKSFTGTLPTPDGAIPACCYWTGWSRTGSTMKLGGILVSAAGRKSLHIAN
jgi:hypothetical protein